MDQDDVYENDLGYLMSVPQIKKLHGKRNFGSVAAFVSVGMLHFFT